jgi:hypothetical protein
LDRAEAQQVICFCIVIFSRAWTKFQNHGAIIMGATQIWRSVAPVCRANIQVLNPMPSISTDLSRFKIMQVIQDTHAFYTALKSGWTENEGGLSLIWNLTLSCFVCKAAGQLLRTGTPAPCSPIQNDKWNPSEAGIRLSWPQLS